MIIQIGCALLLLYNIFSTDLNEFNTEYEYIDEQYYAYQVYYNILLTIIVIKTNKLKAFLEPNMLTIGYNSIYYYSKCQIIFNNCKSVIVTPVINCLKRFKFTNDILFVEIPIIQFYNNGNEKYKRVYNGVVDKAITEILLETDLVILSDKNNETDCMNKIHFTVYPEKIEYIVSNIKFISLVLEYNTKLYTIDLKTENYNHYIINNILNVSFFKYYLINILSEKMDKEEETDFNYKLTLIDHNVDIFELTSNQYLVIKENGYEIEEEQKEEEQKEEELKEEELKEEEQKEEEEEEEEVDSDNSYDNIKLN